MNEYYWPAAFLRDDEQMTIARTLIQSMMQVRFQLKFNDPILNSAACWSIIANAQLTPNSPAKSSSSLISQVNAEQHESTAAAPTKVDLVADKLLGSLSEARRTLSEATRNLAETTFKGAEVPLAQQAQQTAYQQPTKKTRKKRTTAKVAAIADAEPTSPDAAAPKRSRSRSQGPADVEFDRASAASSAAGSPSSIVESAELGLGVTPPPSTATISTTTTKTASAAAARGSSSALSTPVATTPPTSQPALSQASAATTATSSRIPTGPTAATTSPKAATATATSHEPRKASSLRELEQELLSNTANHVVRFSNVFDVAASAPGSEIGNNGGGGGAVSDVVFDAFSTGGDLLRVRREDIDIAEPIGYIQSVYQISIERSILEAAELVAQIESNDEPVAENMSQRSSITTSSSASSSSSSATTTSATLSATPSAPTVVVVTKEVAAPKPEPQASPASATASVSGPITMRYSENTPLLRPAAGLSLHHDSIRQLETFSEQKAIKPPQADDRVDEFDALLTAEEHDQVALILAPSSDGDGDEQTSTEQATAQTAPPLDLSRVDTVVVVPDRRDIFGSFALANDKQRAKSASMTPRVGTTAAPSSSLSPSGGGVGNASAATAASPARSGDATFKHEELFMVPLPTRATVPPSTPTKQPSFSSFPAIDTPEPPTKVRA